ncbi:deoxyribodipyrimidine photo-lyase [Sphingomonas sp. ID1715]|uniref:cryptochrome/photolyase family protein n=1 Tax=Sphingomonas sp. ID1715 TaxID=1656898 RepID=UPI0014880ECF|nr:deoxyribodipyrimidine photo-lyase [Sphingomonas sp. ID1715]NNM78627.1 deoxyribodipyrimidine photo-lyase [Sphingomonas sp. ID1715]
MTQPSIILWLRQDLRLADQAALVAAVERGAVIPLYVLDDETPCAWRIGGAQRWWLHHSLAALDSALQAKGSRLILRKGPAAQVVAQVVEEVGAAAVHAIRHYEPWWIEAERTLASKVDLVLHDGNQLAPPDTVRTGSGGFFKIYTPFWRALSAMMPPPKPQPAPKHIPAPKSWPKSDTLESWQLLPSKPNWAAEFDSFWTPGEAGAHEALEAFADRVDRYHESRNLPSEPGSSQLSPHLHFGGISPAQVWHRLDAAGAGLDTFRSELGWRDFTTGVIARARDYAAQHGRSNFDAFPWRSDGLARADLHAWQQGRTGYPIVDAGMRQLWRIGWMHNRVRMIAASFLVKHLLIDWRAGERWFWDTLVDADYGNNAVNWQWVAGTGVDSNQFGRIMAPLVQSAKFGAADYIRRWVPELAHLSDADIHDPPAPVPGYPEKLIGHREARERALAAARAIR